MAQLASLAKDGKVLVSVKLKDGGYLARLGKVGTQELNELVHGEGSGKSLIVDAPAKELSTCNPVVSWGEVVPYPRK